MVVSNYKSDDIKFKVGTEPASKNLMGEKREDDYE